MTAAVATTIVQPQGMAAAPATALENRPVPVGLVILLGALTAFGPMSIDMYLPGLPAIAKGLHGSLAQAEQTLSAFFVGLAVGQLVYGPLSDRIGRRGPLLFGAALYVAASLACAFAPNLAALTALRFVQALGGCAGMVIARAVVRDRFEHHQVVQVLSLLLLVMGVAPILAPFLGGLVLTLASWRGLFLILTGFGVLAGLAVLIFLKESRTVEDRAHARGESPLRSYAALLTHPRLVGYLLTGSLAGAALFAYISTASALIIETYGVSPQMFGWVFGANAIGYIGAGQLNRGLVRRWGSDRVLGAALIAALVSGWAVLAGALTGFGGPAGVLAPLFCMMATMGLTQPNATAGALGCDPRRSGAISSLVGSGTFGVGALTAAAAGALPFAPPLRMGLVIALAMSAAMLAHRLLITRRPRSPKPG